MDIRKLQRVILDALEDVKAQRIEIFNTESQSPLFERVLIASGASQRQTKALAASVCDAVKSRFGIQPRLEGEENGEWIIVDCGPAVIHVMQPAIRDYYHLEDIWGAKPVRLKTAALAKTLPKASEADNPGSTALAQKTPLRKPLSKRRHTAKAGTQKPKTVAVKKPKAPKKNLMAS